MDQKLFISVSVKTLSESKYIGKTIDNIREQLIDYPHKIIVTDSLSMDNVQRLATDKRVTVVSLADPGNRYCGVGHQLGYLYSKGGYLLLMDGDMELGGDFVDQTVTFLQVEPEYAGVVGTVRMDDAVDYESKSREQCIDKIYPPGDSDHPDGSGLYRRSATGKIGYFTSHGLYAYREAGLSLCLIEIGYKLRYLDIPYFNHTSYTLPTSKMLARRWTSGYYQASGELLRYSWGKPWFFQSFNIVKNEAASALCLILLFAALLNLNINALAVALLPLLAFTLLKIVQNRSLTDGLQNAINSIVHSTGLVKDILYPICDSLTPSNSRIIHKQPGQAP